MVFAGFSYDGLHQLITVVQITSFGMVNIMALYQLQLSYMPLGCYL